MPRVSLVETVTDRLLDRIISGEFPEGSALPPEAALAEQSGASRLTVREAVRVLSSQHVVRALQGRGTFVNPVTRWTSLEALVRMQRGDASKVIAQLVEVRAMIEVGAAELFAVRVSNDDLAGLRGYVEQMRAAHDRTDVGAFVAADLAFHDLILDGCGNPFVPATFLPISRALRDARTRTSSVTQIREHAIVEHSSIIEALETGSAEAAAAAMRSHLIQTRDDARRYLQATGDGST